MWLNAHDKNYIHEKSRRFFLSMPNAFVQSHDKYRLGVSTTMFESKAYHKRAGAVAVALVLAEKKTVRANGRRFRSLSTEQLVGTCFSFYFLFQFFSPERSCFTSIRTWWMKERFFCAKTFFSPNFQVISCSHCLDGSMNESLLIFVNFEDFSNLLIDVVGMVWNWAGWNCSHRRRSGIFCCSLHEVLNSRFYEFQLISLQMDSFR